MNSIAPASCARMPNEYYKSEEELLYACADAMREEYKAIIDAGLTVSSTIRRSAKTGISKSWSRAWKATGATPNFVSMHSTMRSRDCRPTKSASISAGGAGTGLDTTDIPMKHLVDLMLTVNCDYYSFEAANARHEHEWKLWKDIKLPAGKKILPGVVTHSTNLIEDPELFADRIIRFADAVGRENVIASTDCGLGGRVHPQIAWAKLKALSEGAELATRHLGKSGRRLKALIV